MWASIKHWWNTAGRSPRSTDPIQQAYIEQNKLILDFMRQQQETLDRIVAAKFDRPIVAATPALENEPMPPSMLNDVLFNLSDEDFIDKVMQ